MAFLLPIFYLYYGAVLFGGGGVNLSYLSKEEGPLINTLVTGLGGALIATTLGSIYAWIVSRTDVPGKRFLNAIPLLALTMPLLTKGFGWIFLFSPNIGLINGALTSFFHLSGSPFDIYGAGGIIFATGVGGVPLAYLIMKPALDSFDPSLEETSRVVGNSPLRTFMRVTLPGILPALASVFFLLFIDGMSLLDYALILGEPVRYNTLATEVDYWASESIPPQFGIAGTLSLEYIAMTLVLVTIYVWLTRKSFTFAVIGGKASRETVNKLRKWKIPAFLICFGIFTFSFILPFVTLLFVSFTKSYTFLAGGRLIATYWFGNWQQALALPLLWQSFENSILFALAAGVLSTVIALFLSYGFLKSRVRGARLLEYISYMPFVIPGIVYGLALFWTFLFAPGLNILYGTIWPMVFAVTFMYLPKSVRMISGNMVQISNELEESPRVCGVGWWRTLWRVVIPLVKGGMINSFLYTFVDSIRELGAVILLTTSSTMVLDVLLLNLWNTQASSLGMVSAASVMVTIFIGAVLMAAEVVNPSSRRSTITTTRKLEPEPLTAGEQRM